MNGSRLLQKPLFITVSPTNYFFSTINGPARWMYLLHPTLRLLLTWSGKSALVPQIICSYLATKKNDQAMAHMSKHGGQGTCTVFKAPLCIFQCVSYCSNLYIFIKSAFLKQCSCMGCVRKLPGLASLKKLQYFKPVWQSMSFPLRCNHLAGYNCDSTIYTNFFPHLLLNTYPLSGWSSNVQSE